MNKELIKKARKGDKQAFSLIFNEDYRKEMEIKYSKHADNYRLKNSIVKIEEMFNDAIREYK